MNFDDFDFSSLAPNSKQNLIYSCLGFSMGFLIKKYFRIHFDPTITLGRTPSEIQTQNFDFFLHKKKPLYIPKYL